MQNANFIHIATQELINKTFGVTEQFLDVHEIEIENDGSFKIARVDNETYSDYTLIYFNVKKERFYFVVVVNDKIVTQVYQEDYHAVYLKCISDDLTFEELSVMTKLKSSNGWSKGDICFKGKSNRIFSAIHFEPNPEPERFEVKMDKLLEFLERDFEGIQRLIENTSLCITIASIFHNGNTHLSGHRLTTELIQRIAKLNLDVDFDLYAKGNFYKN